MFHSGFPLQRGITYEIMCFLFIKDNVAVLEKLLLPLLVSGINLIMPMAFRIIATLERYKSPRTAINVNLAR